MSGVTGASATPPRGLSRIAKPSAARRRELLGLDALEHGQRRRLERQARQEPARPLGRALDLESTPRESLSTKPPSPSSPASR